MKDVRMEKEEDGEKWGDLEKGNKENSTIKWQIIGTIWIFDKYYILG